MALRINQEITTREGFTVASGTIVKFSTTFPKDGNQLHCNMEFYKDQAAYDNGDSNYFPSELDTLGYVKELDAAEYSALTPTQVHIYLRDNLELTYTAGTIDIIQ